MYHSYRAVTSKKNNFMRDKTETKEKILAAVGKLLAEGGFNQLGINAIAREAGVDKVLIYRYFDNLPSLLKTFGQEGNYWITPEDLIGEPDNTEIDSLPGWMVLLLGRLLTDLQQRPVTQEIMRWELLEGNDLTQELANVRDRTALASLYFLQQKYPFPPGQDIPAISAILVAGIVYLVLRTKVSHSFMGIDFSSPAGWERIEAAFEELIRSTISPNISQDTQSS
jgi:AcrR family transcriptional regulator